MSKTEEDSSALDWRMGCGTPDTQKGIEKCMGCATRVPLVGVAVIETPGHSKDRTTCGVP